MGDPFITSLPRIQIADIGVRLVVDSLLDSTLSYTQDPLSPFSPSSLLSLFRVRSIRDSEQKYKLSSYKWEGIL